MLGVLADPTNFHALSVLSERTASAKEIAAELGCSARLVSVRLGKLEELGLIEEVAGNGRAGGKCYRALKKTWFDRQTWGNVDPGDRAGITRTILGLIERDLANAIVAGTLDGDNNHISRTPLLLDAGGYEELVALLDSTLEEIVEINARAEERISDPDEAIQTNIHLVQCDLPPLNAEQP